MNRKLRKVLLNINEKLRTDLYKINYVRIYIFINKIPINGYIYRIYRRNGRGIDAFREKNGK